MKTLDKLKTVFRFDVGASGFIKMIYTLIATAILVLLIGGYFLWDLYR